MYKALHFISFIVLCPLALIYGIIVGIGAGIASAIERLWETTSFMGGDDDTIRD
jgi:hypothetical protein